MAGQVITFYSYKGGVGRTFALANVGVILAQWDYRVLVVDWDIEAPGLNHYFSEYSQPPKAGVLDFLLDCQNDSPKAWNFYTSALKIPDCRHGIHIMAAAAEDADYTGLVQSLDWDELYDKHKFGMRVEVLRSEWVKAFDFILIDSRTGVTDFSGLTTAQLPDILAFLFTANVQSLEGCCSVAERSMQARRNIPIDRPALVPLPIVAKFEQREEYDRAQIWRSRFLTRLDRFYDIWAPKEIDRASLVDLLTIPYVPRWTFGEDLAALNEPRSANGIRTSGAPISYTLETIAATLANNFNKIDLLCSSRDEYVLTARAAAQTHNTRTGKPKRIFISRVQADSYIAELLSSFLKLKGFEVLLDIDTPTASASITNQIERLIDYADAMIVVVGRAGLISSFQNREIEWFLRQSLRSEVRKPLIPLILSGAEKALENSRLADFASLEINISEPLSPQFESLIRRLSLGARGAATPQTEQVAPAGSVYLFHTLEDEESAYAVAVCLQTRNVEVLLPAFEGEPTAVAEFHRQSLKECDAVVIYWGSASEVWVRAQASGLRSWADLGRTQPFSFRGVIAGPPVSRRKLVLPMLMPRAEIDITLDLSEANRMTPELLVPITDLLL